MMCAVGGTIPVAVLSELGVGETAIVDALDLSEGVRNHLMHMGFVPDTPVKALRRAPAGDPTVYRIDGMEIALRADTAKFIRVRPAGPAETQIEEPAHQLTGAVR